MKFILSKMNNESVLINVETNEIVKPLKRRIQEEQDLQLLELSGNINHDQSVTPFSDDSSKSFNEFYFQKCAVLNCYNTKKQPNGKTFFNFPNNAERCQHWLILTKREDLLCKPFPYISQNYFLCSDHFTPDYFFDQSKTKLKVKAIPTIFNHNEKPIYSNKPVNTKEEVVENFSGNELLDRFPYLLCRLCAQPTFDPAYIYNPLEKDNHLADKINTCLPITVRDTDPLPKQICPSCIVKLDVCYQFSESCVQAENSLRSLHKRKHFKSQFQDAGLVPISLIPFHPEEQHPSSREMSFPTTLQVEAPCFCCPLCYQGTMIMHSNKLEMNHASSLNNAINLNENASVANKSSEYQIKIANFNSSTTILEKHEPKFIDLKFMKKEQVSCRICAKEFETKDLCLDHAKDHNEKDMFPCSICYLSFSSEFYQDNHIEDHKNLKSNSLIHCNSCGLDFYSEKSVKEHHCQPHLKTIESFSNLLSSTMTSENPQFPRNEEELDRCPYCGKHFVVGSIMLEHIKIDHMDEKILECPICGLNFMNKDQFMNHEKVHLQNGFIRPKPFEGNKIESISYNMPIETPSTSKNNLELDIKSQSRSYQCKLCQSLSFVSYSKLLEHRRKMHSEIDFAEEDLRISKPFRCEECGKSFAYRVTLTTHKRLHTGELPFQCEFCEKKFSQKRSLVLHRRTHTGEKPYGCDICGKRFVQSAHLYAHKRLHTGEKPYNCSICDAKFRLKDVRDAHLRKHTGERPFKCNVCDKAFRTSHSYYQHMWIHQGKKPYPCEYCGKAFRRSNGLKIHIRIHTGEKPHACDICGRCFAQKQDMKKHRNLHLAGKL